MKARSTTTTYRYGEGGRIIRALTICQPWPYAIFNLGKRVENRTWATAYRGRLLIHAGKSRQWLGGLGDEEPNPESLVFGGVVGVCTLADCVRYYDWDWPTRRANRFASGPFCWILENVIEFDKPILCNGKQGLWDAPDEWVLQPGRVCAE